MENSIEEDIKILEELRIANENCIKNAKIKDNPFVAIWEKQNRAIEHILSDYKRVLKENEELNLKYYMLYTGKIENLKAQEFKIKSQVIPVQTVKDKIEEEKLPLTIVGGRKNKKTLEYGIKLGRRQALQELIEESEEK